MMTLDEQVNDLVDHMTDQLAGLSADPYFREAMMKASIRGVCHHLHQKLELLPDEIADHLDIMAEVMRDEGRIGREANAGSPRQGRAPPVA